MPKKPKIKIGGVWESAVAICVPFEFDTGERGQLNFPKGTDEEEIKRALRVHYDTVEKRKKVKSPKEKLKNSTLDW